MRIHTGTSGYNYPEWRGSFYPDGIKAKDMFAFYAERFGCVEINYTFYRMPTEKTTSAWLAQAPDGFQYVLKAPRRITHLKRLKECDELVEFFCTSARVLGSHLGPLLFQLPPNMKCDLGRLEAFLELVPRDIRAVFEFRHASWLTEDVFEALARHQTALCIADVGDRTTPIEATARHGYFRLRDEGYSPGDLQRWVGEIASRADLWDEVYVFFKHEQEGKGAEFARAFSGLAAEQGLGRA